MSKIKKGDWVLVKGPKGLGELQFLGTDGETAYVSADGIRVSGLPLDRFLSMVVDKPNLASLKDLDVAESNESSSEGAGSNSNEGQGEEL